MSNGQASKDTAEVWGQILFEARENRSKQDAQLASAQRQSQFLVAGFLAVTALVITAVSTYVASQSDEARSRLADSLLNYDYSAQVGISVFTVVTLMNGLAWFVTHRMARRLAEKVETEDLLHYPGSEDALVHLRRHLVRTLTAQLVNNERAVIWAHRIVIGQVVLTFLFFYALQIALATYALSAP
ncbi:MAG: hypothetical protein F4118_11250 [Acidimicrobiaceae bacterium]|nr:hypothetical protein [Acidimicrobiaceae bacterium]MYI36983.1 hypothetical protein [Acidimicrobiaceae bacterium]